MSNEGIFLCSARGGDFSLRARLNHTRGRLFEVSVRLNELESNLIFASLMPEIISVLPKNDNEETTENDSDKTSHTTDNSLYFSLLPSVINTPSELRGNVAECMNIRYRLILDQTDIVGALDEEKKKSTHANDLEYYYSGNENGLF